MFDVDYAPAVFAGIIVCVFVFPAIYGIFFVDKYKYWEKTDKKDDAFN
jgi:hypothetical protein